MRIPLSLLLLAGASALSLPALAQETLSVDEIIVTAARSKLPANALPLTVDVINSKSLAEQAAIGGSVVDAVSTLLPSFSPTRQKLSGAGETLRGRSPLYAINGIPQSTPLRDGSRDGFTIDPFFVDRVEVIYGSNALQGIGGTGGIVNQVTVGPPRQDGVSGKLLVQGSSDDGFSGDGRGGKLAGLLAYREGPWDAMVGGAYEKRGAFYDGQGRRIGVDSTQGETQDSQSWSAFGRFGYETNDGVRLDLMLNRFQLKGDADYVMVLGNQKTGLPTSAKRGTPPGDPAQGRTESAALTLTADDLAGGAFTAQAFFNRTQDTFGSDASPVDTFQDIRIAPLKTLYDQSQNRSRKLGAKLSYERAMPGFEALTTIVGLDTLFDKTEQRLIKTGRKWVPPTDFRSLAPFAQFNLSLLEDRLHLAAGVRHENGQVKIDDYTTLASTGSRRVKGGKPTFNDTLFNGGIVAEPWEDVRLYGSYAQGYTMADIGRITRAINKDGVDLNNFLDIDPVISDNREIGVELGRGSVTASAAYFWSTSKKGQNLVLVGGVYEVQRQRVEIEGLELNASWETPVTGLTLSAGYAHLDGRTDSNGDGKVDIDLDGSNISPDRVNVAAAYAYGPVTARLQTQFYIARRFDGGVKDSGFGGYNLTDLLLRHAIGTGGLTLSISNLFDKQYITYYSETTRVTDDQRLFAGRGRTLTLGWDYSF